MLYQVTGHVHMEKGDDVTLVHLPTFFLDSDIQGIVSADHAKRIAADMIQSVMTCPSATFFSVIERNN
jgi:hypothetical protein